MALNIKNAEVESLAAELARLAGETKTEAIRRSLAGRKQRLLVNRVRAGKGERLRSLLEERIWPEIPRRLLGKSISGQERERILGYGPAGV